MKTNSHADSCGISRGPARIEELHIENYRALRCITLKKMTPLTALLGPNGSGKSTVFDAFNFLSECFQDGLRCAWDGRGRAREIRTRGQTGPVKFQVKYREAPDTPLITFHLAIDEENGKPIVVEEWMSWRRGRGQGRPLRILDYKRGQGGALSGDAPEETSGRVVMPLRSPDVIAVSTLGQFADHPRVAALREFIIDWHVSYLSIDATRGQPDAGPHERLSKTGDNLPNVVQYLKELHPERLERIFDELRKRVPRLQTVHSESMPDGRLLLQIKDAPFEQRVLSRFASDGTLKLLAYLILLHDPNPSQFTGIEEPENFLHPRLLPQLAEACRQAAEKSQLLITTHSPFFLNGLRQNEVRVLYRDEFGYTQTVRVDEVPMVKELCEEGGSLGDLWIEGHFGVGDPLVRAGIPAAQRRRTV